MIKPTIGRVVWYRQPGSTDEQQPNAAIVCYVHSDECVNLTWFDYSGGTFSATSVFLYQNEGEKPSSGFCEWMPYQIGQAAKTA